MEWRMDFIDAGHREVVSAVWRRKEEKYSRSESFSKISLNLPARLS